MKLVIVLQENNNKYLFKVPENEYIFAGQCVSLDTCYGRRLGYALCDSFTVSDEDAEMIMKAFSTRKDRMKPVLGVACITYFKETKNADSD